MINSRSFVEEAKNWNIATDEVQVSYDVVNLYPSVPVKEATEVLVDQLNKDKDLKQHTKLTIKEIKSLIDICLSRCYFIWNNEIHELENAGPIGLSLMVVMAEGYLQYLEAKAINEALLQQPPIHPKSFKRYVDDSHARFTDIGSAEQFKNILNRQDQRIQYTMEKEDESKNLEFLDIRIMNSGSGKYEFDIYRKKAITNVQVKPSSSHDPKILRGIFKGFVHRAFTICSQNYIEKELEFLVTVFLENGYKKKELQRTIKEVRSKLLRNEKEHNENAEDETPTITLPWIPEVSPKLKKVYKKAGYRTVFKSGRNLQTILTNKNKTKLPKNSQPGVYKIPCKCNKVPPYIGETKLKIGSRFEQHEGYVTKGQWEKSGAALHQRDCGSGYDGIQTIKIERNKFNRLVRESLEIQYHQSGPNEGNINQDDGKYVKTKFWVPMLRDLQKKAKLEPKIRENRRKHRERRELQQTIDSTSNRTRNEANIQQTSVI